MRFVLWNLATVWYRLCDKYQYSYDETFQTDILLIQHRYADQYLVTCWNGSEIFSFIDTGDTKIYARKYQRVIEGE